MDFAQLWKDYQELILVVATAVLTLIGTLLAHRVLPGLWGAVGRLFARFSFSLGRRLAAGAFEKRYLKWLCEEHRFLRVRGIRTRSPVAVQLEQVYITLTLNRPSCAKPGRTGEGNAAFQEQPSERLPPEPARLAQPRAEPFERLSLGEVLQRCPDRLAILGDPGTGKTTLLSYLVLKFAQDQAHEALDLEEKRLPIPIALRDLPRTGLSLTAGNIAALAAAPDIAGQCPSGFFAHRLETGRCIVLLDGMDEVTTEEERRRVAEQIENLVTTYPANRYIVTSRPAGYSGVALAGFAEVEVCDFSDEDVEAFARNWCLAVELALRQAENQMSEDVARRQAEREAQELVVAIRANDRVRRLTVNPLLLTIVALVHRYRATLPNRRVDLYDECTQVLLGYWDEAKGIAGELDWARKRRVLEPLAHWMHVGRVREAAQPDVERIIAEALPTVGEKAERAGEFLRNVRDRSGLLMERGLGVYGFSHLTFQEYLTANRLIDEGQAGREELLTHLDDPWWLEVTLLYAGLRDASPLIEAILSQRDDLFKNNLFLAVRCLIDVLNLDPLVEEAVLGRLMEEFRTGEFQGLRDQAVVALVELSRSPIALRVAERLVGLLADPEVEVRTRAASALGEIGRAEPAVVEGLVGLLAGPEAEVRASAASALGELGRAEPAVVDGLVGLLADPEAEVRASAASALGELGRAEPALVEGLVGLLSDPEAEVRTRTAFALGEIARAEPAVVERLVGLLAAPEAKVRASATFALGEIGRAEPALVEGLVGLLADPEADVRTSAASALGRLGRAESAVVEGLVDLLADPEPKVRWLAVSALSRLGRAEPAVVQGLVGLLADPEAEVRTSAASTLGEIGRAEPAVVKRLVGLLADPDAEVRTRAASALGRLGRGEPAVVDGLVGLLADPGAEVRASTTFALGELGRAEPAVVERLAGLLADPEAKVRWLAASALSRLGRADQVPVDAVLGWLTDLRQGNQIEAVGTLRTLRDRQEVVDALLNRVLHPEEPTCAIAVQALDLGFIRFQDEVLPAVVHRHVRTLKRLMDYVDEVDYSFLFGAGAWQRSIRDVAWDLLQLYYQQTGERIYRANGDEGR